MTRSPVNTRDIIPPTGSNTEQCFLRRKLSHPHSYTFFAPWHLSSLLFLASPQHPGSSSCSPSLFLQSLLSTSGLFTSQWEAKRCTEGSADRGRKYTKALAESSRTGVETGVGRRKKGCWRGAEGGLYVAMGCLWWRQCWVWPKGWKSFVLQLWNTRFNLFQTILAITMLTLDVPFLPINTQCFASCQITTAQWYLTLISTIVSTSPFSALVNSCLGNPFLTTQSLLSPIVKWCNTLKNKTRKERAGLPHLCSK